MLKALQKCAMDANTAKLYKTAFQPPAGEAPPMDPAMMGGGGMPPMDPAMMGGGGGGGMPPMDPAMMGMPPLPEGPGEGAPNMPEDPIVVSESELTDKIREIVQDAVKGGGSSKESSNKEDSPSSEIDILRQRVEELEAQLGGGAPAAAPATPNAPETAEESQQAVKEMFTPSAQQDMSMANPEMPPEMSKQGSETPVLSRYQKLKNYLRTEEALADVRNFLNRG